MKKVFQNFQIVPSLIIMSILSCSNFSVENKSPEKPLIKKVGTIDGIRLAETTPIVFHDKLWRFEFVNTDYKDNNTGKSYFRFIDVESGEPTPSFAVGYELGSAIVEGNTVYVYGVTRWGESDIYCFSSTDLQTWSSRLAITLPGWALFNNSVCKGKGGDM